LDVGCVTLLTAWLIHKLVALRNCISAAVAFPAQTAAIHHKCIGVPGRRPFQTPDSGLQGQRNPVARATPMLGLTAEAAGKTCDPCPLLLATISE
jgi:hypothetical protein